MFLNEFRDSNYTRQASEEELNTNTVLHTTVQYTTVHNT
jgi:hypothetical protein